MKYLSIFALVGLLISCSVDGQQEKPNIVLILTDDLGTGDVACYNEDSKIPTPNMDLLASQGAMFTDAHTGSAVCTPTRYGIMTGRYCWRTRLKKGVLNGYGEHLIDPGRTTIASLLKTNGYYTAGIGKWHLGMDFPKNEEGTVDFSGRIENSPTSYGFDYFHGIAASLDFPPYVYIENEGFTMVPMEEQKSLKFPRYLRKGPKAADFDFETAWEHLLEKAIDQIREKPGDKPLFLYFALPSPHKPVWPDQRFQNSTDLGPYGDFVYQTDHIIGQIQQELEKQRILDETLFIVTSDNGSFMFRMNDSVPEDHLINERVQGFYPDNHQSNYLYRGTKADIWEAGHRVPFIVHWPGIVDKGFKIDNTICTTDFLATFADILNIELTANEGEDSFSFLPLVKSEEDEYNRAPVVNHSSAGLFAIRKGEFKLILGNGSGGRQHPRGKAWEEPFMLYNLDKDPSETNDIIIDNKELAEEMQNALQKIIDSGTSRDGMHRVSTLAELEEHFEGAAKQYQMLCAGCHGQKIAAFVDRNWKDGYARDYLVARIGDGDEEDGMPAFADAMTEVELGQMAEYIITSIENRNLYEFEKKFDDKDIIETEELNLKLELVAEGLEIPWGLAFLPDGDMLIADRNGKLHIKSGENMNMVNNVPEVWYQGQGGLMDVRLHPDFENNKLVYLSYSKFKTEGEKTLKTTAIVRGRLNGNSLENVEEIFEALPYWETRHHYGCRMDFDEEGYLYISIGDRGKRDINPQALDNHCGKIHRLHDDGAIPEDNPFINTEGAIPSIYSYGHRNPQGLVKHPETGEIWTHEHGPRGGDEINIIEKGKNYGWPLVSFGINYDGSIFTSETHREGMEDPLHYWVPSIAPCGMDFVKGDKYPGWEGDLMIGSLRFRYLHRCNIKNGQVVHEELLLKNIGRLRNVQQGPDGYIYIGVEDPGRIYKLVPVSKSPL